MPGIKGEETKGGRTIYEESEWESEVGENIEVCLIQWQVRELKKRLKYCQSEGKHELP